MAGNARFHNKWHRRSHHTSPSIGYPDSATDPIASHTEPFIGDFVVSGTLSASKNLYIDKDATIQGSLSVYGDISYFETYVSVTSSLSVVNTGPGPAVVVEQYKDQPIARFIDPDNSRGQKYALSIENEGYVVVNETKPAIKFDQASQSEIKQDLTVNGNAYAAGGVVWERPTGFSIYVSTTGSDLNSGLNPSQKLRTIKKACKLAFDLYGPFKCTIFVETGDYTEINPIYVPAGTAILGDGYLRRVTVRPYHRQMDLFWLNTACYMWGFTFRDTLEPCAATAFPNLLSGTPAYKAAFQTPNCELNTAKPGGPFGLPLISKPYVVTSPYTQGMSSITTKLICPIQPDIYIAPFSPNSQVYDFTFLNGADAIVYMLSSFNNIIDIIKGGVNAAPAEQSILMPSPGAIQAASLIELNKTNIQNAVISYINAKYPLFVYNTEVCYRDTGYILDAVIYDLTNNTNLSSISAGKYYWEYGVNQIPGQEIETVDAISYAKSLATLIVQNSAVPIYEQQFDFTKFLAPDASSNISLLFNTIASTIRTGVFGTVQPITITPGASDASFLLNLNKKYFGKIILSYVDKTFPGFFYDKNLCERDVGYLIEAVTYDLTNGSTLCAVDAGRQYYKGTVSKIRGQEIQTASAVTYLNFLAQKVITNTIAVTGQTFNPYMSSGRYAAKDVSHSFDLIKKSIITAQYPAVTGNPQFYDLSLTNAKYTSAYISNDFRTIQVIITGGTSQSPSIIYFSPSPYASDAVTLIQTNSAYLQGEVIKFVDTDYPSLRYNRNKCFRDTGYLLEAVNYDLTEGTNLSAVLAGELYWYGAGSAVKGQEKQTTAAVGYLNTMCQDIINNRLITSKRDAASLLKANKVFIQKEVVSYVDKVYPTFVYDRDKCERDTGYIIDAIIYDLTNNTNASAVEVAQFYPAGIANQEIQTAMAVNFAKRLALYVIENIAIEDLPTGCGIRVDGELALGFLRSFVTDSFTQYNQSGKGIHIINCGYAQLVSTFTICTTEGVMTESGGQCSISTSNCSFGLSGLVAVGKSKFPVLTGYQVKSAARSTNLLYVEDVTPRPLSAFITALQAGKELEGIPVESPYNGLLVSVEDDPASNLDLEINPEGLQNFLGIKAVSALEAPYPPYSYILTLERNLKAPLTASKIEPKYVEFWLRSQIASSSHAFEYIGTGVDIEKAVPSLGGRPKNDNEVVFSDNGIVYYSSTNERGDFKVGNGFTIVQEKGSVQGIDFNRSILALVTPLILSLD
jgi:hypothetical protein